MNVSECNFCYTKQQGPYQLHCTECGYPIHGTVEEQQSFSEQHAALKETIDDAESALSQARFGLLWPWLAILIGCGIYFLRPPVNLIAFAVMSVVSAFFIASYFLVPLRPVAILLACTVVMLALTAAAIYFTPSFDLSGLMPLALPVLVGSVYAKALFACYRSERALTRQKFSGIRI